ncbi:MAG: branched-chain amino acid ABC transporter permease [Syntrophobacterales bacterium]|jgi:branched-chain amino acid transport system permease protein|nr:branched-chain amino acid ABC transporter permease [Syntrophobacterales bacterium]
MAAYALHLAILAGIYIILTVSINLIVGYAGQVSLGHAAFYGIGAYASALVSLHWHLPWPAAALAALLAAGLCGLALGLPTLRLKEDYLAIVTLGFGVIVDLVFLNLDITGGPDGLPGIPPPSFLGLSFREPWHFLILVVVMVALVLGVTYRLVDSYHGRALRAIRDHEITAQVMGINTPAYKIMIFTLAAALAGLAGSLYAHYITFINPETFGLHTSILILTMVVLGGMGSIVGSVLGAIILTLLPELLREIHAYQDLVYGGLLVVLLIWRPEGLLGRGKLSLKFLQRES